MSEIDDSILEISTSNGPISDVGEKFEGARKDNPSPPFSGDLKGLKSNSLLTKKEIWPKPNFREDVISGRKTNKHALLFLLVYNNLANKPLGSGWFNLNQKAWDDAYTVILEFLTNAYENGHYERLDDLSDDYNAYMDIKFGPSGNNIIEKYSAGKHSKRTVRHPLNFDLETSIRLRNLIHLGWPDPSILDTDNYGATQLYEKGVKYWYAVKSISPKRIETLDHWTKYDKFSEAFSVAKELFQPILDERKSTFDEKKGRAKPPKRPRFDRPFVREGEDYRKDVNINADTLKDTFGFRGIEFGNWVNQKERQWFLNATYDALMDLVTLFGLPQSFASLGKKLGIAFGSRGTGVDGAAAHFEPDNLLIHLTKTQGVGVLAHEFGHALDCYLATRNDLPEDFFSSHFLKIHKFGYGLKNIEPGHYLNLKDGQASDKFLKLLNYIVHRSTSTNQKHDSFNSTIFLNNAIHLDDRRSQYWSEPTEMFARIFECWVTDTLIENDQINEFLVYGTEEAPQSWNMRISAYPTGRERAILVDLMNDWLTCLVDSWKSKKKAG